MSKPLLSLAGIVLAIATAAALPEASPATTSSLQPETLARAGAIRAQVTARYRLAPGRKLVVTEATTTAVVDSVTLLTDPFELSREVPADNGIYFAICPARATCPYPTRSASWPATAFLPRRQALELAVRTFLQTSVRLVVVALPTATPVWLVFERDDVAREADVSALLNQLAADPAVDDAPLRDVVEGLTLSRLFAPIAIVRVSATTETLVAMSLSGP